MDKTMSTNKRTIRGEQYNIEQLVDEAIATVDAGTLDTAAADAYLRRMGHTSPSEELVSTVARDTAILNLMTRKTGASFNGQLGKISFVNRDKAIEQSNAYLNRRNAGHRSRWGK